MTRQPDIQNKANRLVFIPLSPEERELASVTKKLVIQDETTIHDFLLESIELNLKKHNIIIGGNPNRQLLSFDAEQEQKHVYPKCKCGKPSVNHGLHLPSKREYDFCKKCFSTVPQRYDKKIWSFQDTNSLTAKRSTGATEC